MLDRITEAFFSLDLDWRFTYVNRQAETFFGRSRSELLGCEVWEVFPEALGSKAMAEYHRAFQTGVSVAFEAPSTIREDAWLEVRAYPSDSGLSVYFHDITDRKRAEEALRESERRFRLIVEGSRGAFFFTRDADGRFTYVSPSAAQALGYETDELIGRRYPELLAAESADAGVPEFPSPKVECGKAPPPNPVAFQHRDGRRLTFELVETPVRRNGNVVGVQGFARDITDTVAAEQRMRLQAALLNAVGQLVVATAPDGRVTYWNPGAEQLLGWSARDVIGRRVFDFATVPEQTPTPEQIHRQVAEGTPWSGEFMALSHAGEQKPLLLNVSPRLDEQGRVVGTVAVASDLTRQKHAEDILRFHAEAGAILASSLDYETTLASVARLAVAALADWCFVDVLTEDGTIRRVATAHVDPNKEALAEQLLRYPPQLDGPNISSRILRTGESWWAAEISDDDLASLSHRPEHLRILRAMGVRSGMGVPLVARGRIVGAIRLGITESDRRFSEADVPVVEELARHAALAIDNARLHQEARRAVEAREQILRIVSHDLRNPLVAVFAHIELLLERCEREAERDAGVAASLNTVLAAAQQMNRLIEDLLAVTCIDAGRLPISPRRAELGDALREAVETLAPGAVSHGVALNLQLAEADMPVTADRTRLLQVMANLLGNAIRFSPPGSTVTVSAAAAGDLATVTVEDQGTGVPKADRERIFNAFHTAEGSRHSRTGLGLYIARGIVEAHGGRIWVEQAVGGGSMFRFTVPNAT